MTFLRLSRWHWLAFVAAAALVLVMSLLWYSTVQGDQCRSDATKVAPSSGPLGGEIGAKLRSDARRCELKYDKTAWQADGGIDRLILIVLLAAIIAAVAAAFLRAADRRFRPPLTPSAIAAVAGAAATVLILYRILQPPGFNPAAVVKAGAPIGLVLAALLTFGARGASAVEREPAPEPQPEPETSAPPPPGAAPADLAG